MIATVIDGPYSGHKLDHNDLTLYCRFFPQGPRKFFVFPPLERWDDVRHERISKDGPFDGEAMIYELERTANGFEMHLDQDGRRMIEAKLQAAGPQPESPPLIGKYFECVPSGELSDLAGRFQMQDEKDRVWDCKEEPAEGSPWPEGATEVVTLYAENLDELRQRLSDQIG